MESTSSSWVSRSTPGDPAKHEVSFPSHPRVVYLVFMKASFVVSEGISSGAKFETDITIVTRVLDMARLNVFVQVRIVLSVIVTIRAGPTRQLLHHFTPDHHIDI